MPCGIILCLFAGTFMLALCLLRREFSSPALHLVRYIERLSRDPAAVQPVLPSLWQAWVKVVAKTFADSRQRSIQVRDRR